jgi:hypothetical protein
VVEVVQVLKMQVVVVHLLAELVEPEAVVQRQHLLLEQPTEAVAEVAALTLEVVLMVDLQVALV